MVAISKTTVENALPDCLAGPGVPDVHDPGVVEISNWCGQPSTATGIYPAIFVKVKLGKRLGAESALKVLVHIDARACIFSSAVQ